MSDRHADITEKVAAFIREQHLFFVATAPSGSEGHINCSPKGLDTFEILDPHTVAYLDLTGSGIETVAHLNDNGRIVVMFCAFEGDANIVRLHGRGEALQVGTPEFDELRTRFPDYPGARAIIRIHVTRVTSSCGFAVPLYEHRGERSKLLDWAEQKGPDGIVQYQQSKNLRSIDDLAGLG